MEKKAKFEVSGEIVEIGEEKTFSSGFRKRDIVVETSRNSEYPAPVSVTFKKEQCDRVETLHVGDFVEITGFVNGRRWDGPTGTKYFIDLDARSVMVGASEAARGPADGKKTTAASWPELVSVGKAHGESETDVIARCKKYGKTFKEMVAADWQALAAEIVKAHAPVETPPPAEDVVVEDLPF